MSKHCGRFSLVLRSGVILISAAVCLGKLNADPITLDNDADPYGVDQSYIFAQAGGNPGTTVDVNSLPYVTPVSDSNSVNSATLTPNLTTSGLNFGFSEVSGTSDPSGPEDAGARGIIYFQAGSNVTYSITGSITLGGGQSGAIAASLEDMTQGGYLYLSGGQVDPAPGSIVLGTDAGGHSLSGSLTSGDVYAFSVSENVSSSAVEGGSITGNIDISFAQSAPNPTDTTPTDTPAMPPWALVTLALLLVATGSGSNFLFLREKRSSSAYATS